MIGIKISDDRGQVKSEILFDDCRQFRLVYFDAEGNPKGIGELPLKAIRQPLKELAGNWAERQEMSEYGSLLKEQEGELSMESLAQALKQVKPADITGRKETVPRSDRVAIQVVWELLKALAHRWKRLVSRPLTTWQFTGPQEVKKDTSGILHWLFRR